MTGKAKKLKLYVWEDYAPDYHVGIAFAIAESREEAEKLLTSIDGFLGDCGVVIEYDIDKIAYRNCGSSESNRG